MTVITGQDGFPRGHEAVWLRNLDGELVLIDEGIADDILLLWKNGLRTRWSCQGGDDPDSRYVSFDTIREALRAAELLPWVKSAVPQDSGEHEGNSWDASVGLYAREQGWVSPGYNPDITIEDLRNRREVR